MGSGVATAIAVPLAQGERFGLKVAPAAVVVPLGFSMPWHANALLGIDGKACARQA